MKLASPLSFAKRREQSSIPARFIPYFSSLWLVKIISSPCHFLLFISKTLNIRSN